MNSERIKEIQGKTAYPDSVSVQQALFQVWNECQQDFKKTLAELERVKEELEIAKRGGVTVKSKDAIGDQINLVIKTLRERYPKAVTNQTEDDYLRSVNFLNSLHSIVDQNRVLKGELSNYKTAYKQTLAELERHKKLHQGMLDVQQDLETELQKVKDENENLKNLLSGDLVEENESLINQLSQAEKERDELIEAAKKVEAAWINWDEDGSRQMQAAIDEMEQLLTPKE